MQRNIKVLVVEPNKLPYEKTIKNCLQIKQELVGGYIEYTYLEDDYNVCIICNKEGKIDGLPPNRDIGHDIVFGTFIIVGDADTGDDRSLTDDQIEKYKNRFGKESIYETNIKLLESIKTNDLEI